jgi:hypothetical protein
MVILAQAGIQSAFPLTDGMDAPSRYGIVVPEWKWVSTNSRKEGGPL